ncbi:aldo/keto reductase [Clostridium sp. MSJ-8]|nr:aldo/keto reductase [Clostridium sp. MSJ-8]
MFQNEILTTIGQQYGKTPAQVILRWLYQNKIVAIPKSVHEERIRQNYDIYNFELSEQDIRKIEQMDKGRSLILDVPNLDEVYRLHDIRFEQ